MISRIKITFIVLMVSTIGCFAETIEENDSLIRLNPEINYNESLADNYKQQYPYIKYSDNRIIKNDADWNSIYELINEIDSTTFNIVHIGDSHLQADILTSHVRNLLQNRYGNAGRGLIVPFKIAKTNEPRDYSITSNGNWVSSTIMRQPWLNSMGFTGISIAPLKPDVDIKISTLSRRKKVPFKSVRLYKRGNIMVSESSISTDDSCHVVYTDEYIELQLNDTTSTLNFNLSFQKSAALWGFELSNDTTGIIYNTIGNNGATYESYNHIPEFSQQISMFVPDLIIISLGANEAFSRITLDSFRHAIHKLVSSLIETNPQSQLLLVTPMECQRRHYVKRKGRRRRRSYSINEKVLDLRNVILDYASDNNIAVYDWYTIGGGAGASTHWVEDNLLSRDRIHNTAKGYELQGTLFYEALINDINTNIEYAE